MILKVVDIGEWHADVFFCVNKYDESVLTDALRQVDAPIGIVVRMRQIARDDEYNTGFTYSNFRLCRSVMVIGKATNPGELLNTFVHEIRHLTDDISRYYEINGRGEEVGYLSGCIAQSLADVLGKLLCPTCLIRLKSCKNSQYRQKAVNF